MTIREALTEASAALAAAGIESAALDASLLLAKILDTSRSTLIAAGSDTLAEASLAAFKGLVKRRLGGECVAYILGKKEFYGLDFQVNPSVLVPRPETETLVEKAREQITVNREQREEGGERVRVLDLCTGSGAIAIALKHAMPELEVWATDISAAALEVAKANAARLLPPESIHFCQGDLFETTPSLHCSLFSVHCSLIISNPPYVPSAEISGLSPEVRGEPLLALDGGDDGLDLIRAIIAGAGEYLCPGGALLLEADPRQMTAIAALLEQAGFTDIQTYKDLSGHERVINGIIQTNV